MADSKEAYDSRVDTEAHIRSVQYLLHQVTEDLRSRAKHHDASKLISPEKEMFDEYTPRLRGLAYLSDEYKETLEEMKATALAHHYEHNDHHPEHHERGFRDMDLIQMIEMLADWKASTLRVQDGNLERSIQINAERFGYGPEIIQLLLNTGRRMGW